LRLGPRRVCRTGYVRANAPIGKDVRVGASNAPSAQARHFRYFISSPEVIRLAVLSYVKYPLSLRNVEDLLAERGIDISHKAVRYWWNRFVRYCQTKCTAVFPIWLGGQRACPQP
jgi:hypothetical protein